MQPTQTVHRVADAERGNFDETVEALRGEGRVVDLANWRPMPAAEQAARDAERLRRDLRFAREQVARRHIRYRMRQAAEQRVRQAADRRRQAAAQRLRERIAARTIQLRIDGFLMERGFFEETSYLTRFTRAYRDYARGVRAEYAGTRVAPMLDAVLDTIDSGIRVLQPSRVYIPTTQESISTRLPAPIVRRTPAYELPTPPETPEYTVEGFDNLEVDPEYDDFATPEFDTFPEYDVPTETARVTAEVQAEYMRTNLGNLSAREVAMATLRNVIGRNYGQRMQQELELAVVRDNLPPDTEATERTELITRDDVTDATRTRLTAAEAAAEGIEMRDLSLGRFFSNLAGRGAGYQRLEYEEVEVAEGEGTLEERRATSLRDRAAGALRGAINLANRTLIVVGVFGVSEEALGMAQDYRERRMFGIDSADDQLVREVQALGASLTGGLAGGTLAAWATEAAGTAAVGLGILAPEFVPVLAFFAMLAGAGGGSYFANSITGGGEQTDEEAANQAATELGRLRQDFNQHPHRSKMPYTASLDYFKFDHGLQTTNRDTPPRNLIGYDGRLTGLFGDSAHSVIPDAFWSGQGGNAFFNTLYHSPDNTVHLDPRASGAAYPGGGDYRWGHDTKHIPNAELAWEREAWLVTHLGSYRERFLHPNAMSRASVGRLNREDQAFVNAYVAHQRGIAKIAERLTLSAIQEAMQANLQQTGHSDEERTYLSQRAANFSYMLSNETLRAPLVELAMRRVQQANAADMASMNQAAANFVNDFNAHFASDREFFAYRCDSGQLDEETGLCHTAVNETTAPTYSCENGGEPYQDHDGNWMCHASRAEIDLHDVIRDIVQQHADSLHAQSKPVKMRTARNLLPTEKHYVKEAKVLLYQASKHEMFDLAQAVLRREKAAIAPSEATPIK